MASNIKLMTPRQALGIVLGAAFLLMLGANLPGHLSYDSVAQLYEGHFHVRETWGPPIYAWLLGVFDAVIPGTALYVTASGLLFFASLAGLAAIRRRVSWVSVAFAALMALTPQVLIYQAIVWKDVAFANTAVAGCVCLALAFTRWDARAPRWAWLLAAMLLLAVASLVRQNGVIVPIVAVLALGWIGARGSWPRGAAWAGGGLLAVLATMQILSVTAVPQRGAPETGVKTGLRIVQNYDLIGAVTLDRSYRLDDIAAVYPAEAALVRERGPRSWSPDRIDWIDRDTTLGDALYAIPNDVATRQWLDLIVHRPGLYLRIRWQDFDWVFLTPEPTRCLPVYTGVDAPAAKLGPLGIPHRYSDADGQLNNYDTWFAGTPAQGHWAYAVVALLVAGLLLLRRQPADIAMAALMLGALAVAASFFVISIACDYRYLYALDLSALVGLFYVALEPGGFFRRSG
jgi:hypothetical protein